ncbi:MAG: ImmA/IrrE family metallo-endopeptidase [Thaumarchaeota archaeon]|nr:ImmA/IrrE family metallo-endopeptidase [Nitrososphaerota archaeon]
MKGPATYAAQLRKEINYTKIPVDPVEIAIQKGIEVREDDAEGYTGMLLVVDGEALIAVKRAIREPTRKKFTVAHELGHFTIPGHITPERTLFQCSDRDISNFGKANNREFEANWFASELLLPEEHFRERVQYKDLNKRLLDDLCTEFDTSLTATGMRFVSFKPEYAMVYSEKSRIGWFHIGGEFKYFLDVRPGSSLHKDSFAYDFFNGTVLPDTFNEVPSYAWMSDSKFRRSSRLMELSIGSRTYNHVLTFLYVEHEEEDDYDSDYADDHDDYKELDGYLRFRK